MRRKNGDFKGSDERSKGVHYCRKSNRSIFIAMAETSRRWRGSLLAFFWWGLQVIKSTEIIV